MKRVGLLLLNALMLLAIVEVRQASQLAFMQMQDIEKAQRLETQRLNQVKIEYLKALYQVPNRAEKLGFVPRSI